jgi:glycosyltransferase involved in cell wall biosynthesis
VRVAIFAHSLRDAGGRSVGKNLVASLPAAGPGHDFLSVVPQNRGYEDVADAVNNEIVTAPDLGRFRRSWWELSGARRIARRWRADWVVALGNVPMLYRGKSAVLLHDPHLFYPLEDLRHLTRRARLRKRGARSYLRWALPRQDAVFVQTSVAAARVATTYGIDPKKIVVIPNALSEWIRDGTSDSAEVLDLPTARFRFLTLTKYAGRKGLSTLVTMFADHRDALDDVVGFVTIDTATQEGARRLMQRVSDEGLEDRIVNLGPVDQKRLKAIYAAVDAAVLPSLLESYSGVYVESMALGVPIITSDRDFARAVCGDAAVYVDPADPSAIAAAISELAANPALRRELIDAGLARAASFGATWSDCADDLLAALESVAADG